MSTAVRYTPTFTTIQAETLAANHFGISARATLLPGDRDQNFRLDIEGRPAFVLKIANPTEERVTLESQHRMMRTLADRAPDLNVQRVIPGLDGTDLVTTFDDAGVTHLVRVVTFVPGTPLASVRPPRSSALLESLGKSLAILSMGLDGFDDPAAHRPFEWELSTGVETICQYLPLITEKARRDLLVALNNRVSTTVVPRLAECRWSVVHNDANDHNLLVAPAGRVTGIIDFGDMVYSVTVADLAIAVAYAILGETAHISVTSQVVHGYQRLQPLRPVEREVLWDLVLLRLGMSVSICANQRALQPDNPYLTVSERPAWEALERLVPRDPRQITEDLFALGEQR
ncbi:MAG: phosphotransferase [Proteobacteria bacterium]|nr:phosphotransferase [Pseudomonadota bacterium]